MQLNFEAQLTQISNTEKKIGELESETTQSEFMYRYSPI